MRKMLDIIPVKLYLSGLAEIKRVLNNCSYIVFSLAEWEFSLRSNPVFLSRCIGEMVQG